MMSILLVEDPSSLVGRSNDEHFTCRGPVVGSRTSNDEHFMGMLFEVWARPASSQKQVDRDKKCDVHTICTHDLAYIHT